ncbi:MAG: hypothetical protein S4CHLAM2_06020 [Chlamydiales bacterium]|nr:hypothetical protein [Chlamydiales bacterium]
MTASCNPLSALRSCTQSAPAQRAQSCATSKVTISLAAITAIAAIIIGALALSGVAPFASALGTVGGAALVGPGAALLMLAMSAASARCIRKPSTSNSGNDSSSTSSSSEVAGDGGSGAAAAAAAAGGSGGGGGGQ